MKGDPIIDRVREARHEISARFDHDPQKLTAYYIERQKRHQERLIFQDAAQEAPVQLAPSTGCRS